MATFSFGNVPSPIQQALRLAQLREVQNPQLALDRDIQKAIQLQQLQQQSPENQLALQIQQATLQKNLRDLDPAYQQQIFERDLEKARQLYGLRPQLSTVINPTTGEVTVIDKRTATGTGVTQTGGEALKLTPAETFSTVPTDQGIVRVGNRSNTVAPLTIGGEALNAPTKAVKPATVSRFSDANGFLFNQSSTGGPATPVTDGEGNPINIGVANQVISTDQGVFTLPKKSDGGATTPSPTALTGAGGTQLTKTTGKGASGVPTEASKQFLAELGQTAITAIDDLNSRVSPLTVGLGSLTKIVPGSPAADFSADLDTLASDIRLGILQQMKSLSKTGSSGLGALSDREGKVLESSLGSIKQDQSQPNVKKNLKKIRESVMKWNEGVSSAASEGPVNIKTKAEFDKLPSGSQYIGPSGNLATKP